MGNAWKERVKCLHVYKDGLDTRYKLKYQQF